MTETRTLFISCLILISVIICVPITGYPSGAPPSTCADLTPRHGSLVPQTSESPYTVTTAAARISTGNKLRVLMNSPDGEAFKGFLIQARSPNSPKPLGSFTVIPDFAKTINCGADDTDTVTHIDNRPKKSLELEWEPPENFEGPVIITATFVKDGATFWVGVESERVQVTRRSVSAGPTVGISTTKRPIGITTKASYVVPPHQQGQKGGPNVYTNCGSTKVCFGIPSNCLSSKSCTTVVAISKERTKYLFELQAFPAGDTSNLGYVAVGLSQDTKMGDDSVVECTDEGDKVGIYMSVNKGKSNLRLPSLNGIDPRNSSSINGGIYCSFVRDTVTRMGEDKYDLDTVPYFILLARGPLKDDGSSITYHAARESSAESVLLGVPSALGAKSNLLYRLHGAFMLTAWIGLAGTGIIFARYFKQAWVGKQICGKDIWFVWHRIFMILTWTLTCSGFVLIFVEIQGWTTEPSNLHAILGTVTTALTFLQPFGAALRPAPSSPKRPIFNWLHWLVGNCAHILAIVTIFFAEKLTKAELPEFIVWILTAYVTFHVLMHLLLSIIMCKSDKLGEQRVNNFPMKNMSGGRGPAPMERKRDAPHSGVKKFLLGIYIAVIICFTTAVVVIAVLAPIEEHAMTKQILNFFGS